MKSIKTFTLWNVPVVMGLNIISLTTECAESYLEGGYYNEAIELFNINALLLSEIRDSKLNGCDDMKTIIVWNMPENIINEYLRIFTNVICTELKKGNYENVEYLNICIQKNIADYNAYLLKESEKETE